MLLSRASLFVDILLIQRATLLKQSPCMAIGRPQGALRRTDKERTRLQTAKAVSAAGRMINVSRAHGAAGKKKLLGLEGGYGRRPRRHVEGLFDAPPGTSDIVSVSAFGQNSTPWRFSAQK